MFSVLSATSVAIAVNVFMTNASHSAQSARRFNVCNVRNVRSVRSAPVNVKTVLKRNAIYRSAVSAGNVIQFSAATLVTVIGHATIRSVLNVVMKIPIALVLLTAINVNGDRVSRICSMKTAIAETIRFFYSVLNVLLKRLCSLIVIALQVLK